MKLQDMQSKFIEHMSSEKNILDGLINFHPNLSNYIRSESAAIYLDGQYRSVGKVPDPHQVKAIIDWLDHQMTDEDYLVTCSLSAVYPPALAFIDIASGMLAIRIYPDTNNYVLWFRPEEKYTIDWAGNPNKPVTVNPGDTSAVLSPRSSFKLWKETIKQKSLPWTPYELEAGKEICTAIRRIFLRKNDELKQLNSELESRVVTRTLQLNSTIEELEAFSYSVSHDLRSPLRALDGYSQTLLIEAEERLTEKEKFYLDVIRKSSQRMGHLIEDLIKLSQISRNQLHSENVNLSHLAEIVTQELTISHPDQAVDVSIRPDMVAHGDKGLLTVVLENLFGNAWKFTKPAYTAVIRFDYRIVNNERQYYIQDNGIGFNNKYGSKLFIAFQRLHSAEKFPGSGIGLATVQRIIQRHGGKIWAEAEPDKGACFYFTINPTFKDKETIQ